MANINWYPGHMTKSIRMIEENIKLIDALVYVLDARAPLSCINPDFDRYVSRLPVIFVLNKSDLADPVMTDLWKKRLTGDRRIAIAADSTVSKSSNAILTLIKSLCGDKISKYSARGVKATIKVMVLGVPNTGKSTLINNFIGKAKAVTGNKAGVTRGKQWFKVNDYIEVLDTPGTLYPKFEKQSVARKLAFLGCIKDEVVDSLELAKELVSVLAVVKPSALKDRYGIDCCEENDILEQVAKARGFMLKGGVCDIERASIAVIDDFRKGRMGKITLDVIEDGDD